jgi:hypothetical protein
MKRLSLIFLTVVAGLTQTNKLGLFTDEGSVGKTPPGCAAKYDAARGEYRITGGGANVWTNNDAFYFVWKQVSGNVKLQTDVEWVGTGAVAHRKAMLMVRQNLDPNSAYADVAWHGDGLTSLQFRGAANEQTYGLITHVDGPVRIGLTREGSQYTFYAAQAGKELEKVGTIQYVSMKDPVYVGIGVCSHVEDKLETAIFKNVKMEPVAK